MPSAPETRVLDPRDAKAGEYTAAWDAITRLTRSGSSWSGYERKNVFLNCGPGKAFGSVPGVTGLDYNDDGRAAALVDWDGDGAQDLWLRNRTGPRLRLMRNRGSGQHFVSFKLEGSAGTNRDAVGARVTLEMPGQPPLAQTVRAGEGFLAQGTKWVMFGLGTAAETGNVTVRWPGGKQEVFDGAKPGGRFLLKQGTGKAAPLAAPQPVKLESGVVGPLPASGRLAVSLPARVPLPACTYHSPDGQTHTVSNPERGLLLLLYSHSCTNCAGEMQELTAAADKLKAAGLDVLALSVDAASSGKPEEAAVAANVLKGRAWPWPHGSASAACINNLEEFTRALLEYPPPPSVPSAYLIAPGGRVCALYRGATGVGRLLHDLPALKASPDEMRDRSIPVAGRWFTSSPQDASMLEWIFKHFGPAFLEQRIAYLEQAAAAATDKEGFHNQIAASRHQFARNLAGEKKYEESERQFAAAASLGVKSPALYNDYGALLAFLGKNKAAAVQYRRALELDPSFSLARENLERLPSGD